MSSPLLVRSGVRQQQSGPVSGAYSSRPPSDDVELVGSSFSGPGGASPGTASDKVTSAVDGSQPPRAGSTSPDSFDLTCNSISGSGPAPGASKARGGSCTSSGGVAGHGEKFQPGAPPAGLDKLRTKPPSYERDYDKGQLCGEFVRRAGKIRPVLFGPGVKDKVTRPSKLTKKKAAASLRKWDEWNADQGGEKWFESTTLQTPEKSKKGKGKQKAADGSSGEEEEPSLDRRRASDLPRLIAIVFSDQHWESICRSEQGSNNRSANKKESNLLKDRHPVWRKVAVSYLDPSWEDQGSLPSHPVDHEKIGCNGDDEMELEIEAMVQAFRDIDYIAPAER